MSQENKNTSNTKIPKPKFNFYWIYGILFALIIGYQFFASDSLSTKNLSQNDFKTILAENDIEKIEIVKIFEI